jgi:hypothetical protein
VCRDDCTCSCSVRLRVSLVCTRIVIRVCMRASVSVFASFVFVCLCRHSRRVRMHAVVHSFFAVDEL